jgi:uncharacterized membrane protein YtjA (UPF0391 family)
MVVFPALDPLSARLHHELATSAPAPRAARTSIADVPAPQRIPMEPAMLKWALIFAIIALVAGLFGFTGIAAGAASIAKVIFFVFVVLVVLALVFGSSLFRR